MQQIKDRLQNERANYLEQFPQNNEDNAEEVKELTPEDTNRALDFVVKWGKYKGSTYREVYIKDYQYFQLTMLGNLMKKLPDTYIAKALAPLHDPSVHRPSRKKVQPKVPEVSQESTALDVE